MKTNEIIYATWEWDKVTQHHIKHTTKLCSNCGEEEHMTTVLSVYLPTLSNEPYKTFTFGSHSHYGIYTQCNGLWTRSDDLCTRNDGHQILVYLLHIMTNIVEAMFELMTLGQISTETRRPRRSRVSLCRRLSIISSDILSVIHSIYSWPSLFIMASLDLDKVNCEDFQIILHQYFLYSSKVCGSEYCPSYSPFGDMRIVCAAAAWIDLVLSHSIYHRSQCLLILSNDLELI